MEQLIEYAPLAVALACWLASLWRPGGGNHLSASIPENEHCRGFRVGLRAIIRGITIQK